MGSLQLEDFAAGWIGGECAYPGSPVSESEPGGVCRSALRKLCASVRSHPAPRCARSLLWGVPGPEIPLVVLQLPGLNSRAQSDSG